MTTTATTISEAISITATAFSSQFVFHSFQRLNK